MDSGEKDSGRLAGCGPKSPFDLSPVFLVGGSLLVLRSFPGPPVVSEFVRVVTLVPGQGGGFSERFPQ